MAARVWVVFAFLAYGAMNEVAADEVRIRSMTSLRAGRQGHAHRSPDDMLKKPEAFAIQAPEGPNIFTPEALPVWMRPGAEASGGGNDIGKAASTIPDSASTGQKTHESGAAELSSGGRVRPNSKESRLRKKFKYSSTSSAERGDQNPQDEQDEQDQQDQQDKQDQQDQQDQQDESGHQHNQHNQDQKDEPQSNGTETVDENGPIHEAKDANWRQSSDNTAQHGLHQRFSEAGDDGASQEGNGGNDGAKGGDAVAGDPNSRQAIGIQTEGIPASNGDAPPGGPLPPSLPANPQMGMMFPAGSNFAGAPAAWPLGSMGSSPPIDANKGGTTPFHIASAPMVGTDGKGLAGPVVSPVMPGMPGPDFK